LKWNPTDIKKVSKEDIEKKYFFITSNEDNPYGAEDDADSLTYTLCMFDDFEFLKKSLEKHSNYRRERFVIINK